MMTCRLNGLFSIGEDFDDEDLLGTDWEVRPASGPVDVAASVSPCALRAVSSVAARKEPEQKNDSLQQTVESVLAPCNGAASTNRTHYPAAASAAVKTGSRGLRQISSSSVTRLPIQNHSGPSSLASGQTRQSVAIATEGRPMPSKAPDDFDEWDVDLADLDECDRQVGQPFLHRQTPTQTLCAPTDYPAPSAKTLRPTIGGGLQTRPHHSLRELSTPQQVFGPSSLNLAAPSPFATPLSSPIPRPSLRSAGPHSPVVFPGFTATLPAPSPISSIHTPRQAQPPRPWATPGQTPQARGLFETVSPAPFSSTMSPYHALHTPVLTNRLVQLMSASNKFPTNKRPRSEGNRPMTRRFPGPAGRLPQQPQGQIRDEIVVSVPTTPAHGTVARSPSQVAGSQSDEDDFNGGAWAAMKAEMGLDERNPSCFLHSYSVVMVLRKAALKQLSRNKVPNMAVQLKSIIHTHADAKAVFKDPTGEIQGTVHRRLLEDRVDELKVGAVLLLKQVGVFSPSHRNHYLNVTTNNLLRIYSHDGVSLSTTQLPPLILEPMLPSPAPSRGVPREPVSRMHLLFDEEEEEEGQEQGQELQTPVKTRASSRGPAGNPGPQDAGWDADDDLDELLGELPEDTYSL